MKRMLVFVLLLSVAVTVYADHPSEAPEGYVRYLVPVIAYARPGAGGSVWAAEWSVFNESRLRIFMNGPFPFLSLSPIYQDNEIEGKETREFFLGEPLAGFDGAFVSAEETEAESLFMSLRVRDTSVNAQSYGARIPIVRDGAFANTIRLIEIPTDRDYRVTLRLYGYTSDARTAHVRIYDRQSQLLAERDVQLQQQPGHGLVDPDGFASPSYVAFDPLTDAIRDATPFVRVEVTSGLESEPVTSRIWGMASITHNTTQQVSIVTPD